MPATILKFANLHEHGRLFANFFRARRQSFIGRLGWDLPEDEGMEFDQYDIPRARWVVVHEGEDVLGGLRLLPTTAVCGVYSYMIRDAQRGVLGGSIPQDLLDGPAPVDRVIWECTRVFINQNVPMAARRRVQSETVTAMVEAGLALGAERLVALTAGNWSRWYGRRGLVARPLGPMLDIDDGAFQCVEIDLMQSQRAGG